MNKNINSLESNIKKIQIYINRMIDKEYYNYSHAFYVKKSFLNQKQISLAAMKEIEKTTDELMILLRNYPKIYSIQPDIDHPDFLWESTFIEELSRDEKNKYQTFDVSLFSEKSLSDLESELPYLFSIVKYVLFIRYIDYLKAFIKDEEKEILLEKESSIPNIDARSDFGSNFERWQIEILVQCVNEVRLFNERITPEIMENIFSCTLGESLPIAKGKNKLLAYFFSSLDNRSLIERDWQAVCAKNKLFLSSQKGKIIEQGNLSTAVSQNNEFPPKDCHIIDKYIKQLKKD